MGEPVVLTFLGGAETVTGSKLLLDGPGGRLLVDCGLYQGEREWRRRNWEPFAVEPASVDDVVLTHCHLDHSGYLRSEEHTSELQSRENLVCRLLLEKKK